MRSTTLLNRMAVSPNAVQLHVRTISRQRNRLGQPGYNPESITKRPFGFRKYLQRNVAPQDYTMHHFGGTLKGQVIGAWQPKLLLDTNEVHPLNPPTLNPWRTSDTIARHSTRWVSPPTADEEV